MIGSIPACAGEPESAPLHQRLYEVYPRVCGGTGGQHLILPSHRGLSPRVRGNPRRTAVKRVFVGSIPACAGEPFARLPTTIPLKVYPRVVRGNPLQTVERAHGRRSIPACAGEPYCASVSVASQRVYPRVCGGTDIKRVFRDLEKGLSPRVRGTASCDAANALITGLSPRVRGNLTVQPHDTDSVGSIPACAGEPTLRWQRRE